MHFDFSEPSLNIYDLSIVCTSAGLRRLKSTSKQYLGNLFVVRMLQATKYSLMPGSSGHVVPAGENFTYLRVIRHALNYCWVMREARLLPVLDSLKVLT